MKLNAKRPLGQAMVEFLVVIPVLILLIFGTLQFAFIYSAKTTLNYATFQAARLASTNHATYSSMRRGLIRGLAPLYTNSSEASSMREDIASGQQNSSGRRDAQSEVDRYTRIIRISPTAEQLTDSGFGELNVDGIVEIPNDNLMFRSERKVEGASIQDANLLKIRVQYCYKLMVPLVNRVIGNLSELNNRRAINATTADDPAVYETLNDPRFADANRYHSDASAGRSLASYGELCGDRRTNSEGFILTSEAIVRMQSAAYDSDDDEDFEDVMCDGVRMSCP
ncbi:MAG: TadE/TadG family type IV pilus assembly protein [Oceanococcus sp.]